MKFMGTKKSAQAGQNAAQGCAIRVGQCFDKLILEPGGARGAGFLAILAFGSQGRPDAPPVDRVGDTAHETFRFEPVDQLCHVRADAVLSCGKIPQRERLARFGEKRQHAEFRSRKADLCQRSLESGLEGVGGTEQGVEKRPVLCGGRGTIHG